MGDLLRHILCVHGVYSLEGFELSSSWGLFRQGFFMYHYLFLLRVGFAMGVCASSGQLIHSYMMSHSAS